jgi:hypothetical protein
VCSRCSILFCFVLLLSLFLTDEHAFCTGFGVVRRAKFLSYCTAIIQYIERAEK